MHLPRSIGLVIDHKEWIGLAEDFIIDRDTCNRLEIATFILPVVLE